jgi:predicted N-acetyltransferase YhbS
LRCPFDVPDETFMALALARDAYKEAAGDVRYGHEFDDLD